MLNQRGMSHTDSLVFSLSEVATINVQIQKKVTTLLVINLYVTTLFRTFAKENVGKY